MSFIEKARIVASTTHAKFLEIREKQQKALAEREIRIKADREKELAETADRQKREAEEQRQFEIKRDNTNYFHFWNLRGTAYKITKGRSQEGNYLYPWTQLHLDVPGKDSLRVVVNKCDFPVGNGNDIVVVYGSNVGNNTGPLVRIINLTTRSAFDLDDNLERISKKAQLERGYAMKRVNRDLMKYLSSL